MSAYEIYDKDSSLIWKGSFKDRISALHSLESKNVSLGYVLGSKLRIDNSRQYSSVDILNTAISHRFISKHNNINGFLTILPKAQIIHRIAEKINEDHYHYLNACEIQFPTIFNNSISEIANLTSSYENNARMFKVNDNKKELRLSYAADPGLFLWLKGKTIKSHLLPYAISSNLNVLRNYKEDEVKGFRVLREFPMPDFHVLCSDAEALEVMCKNLTYCSKIMRLYFGEDWVFAMDIQEDIIIKHKNIIQKICISVGGICLVNIVKDTKKYYSIKTVYMLDAGDCSIMNFNMQWDEKNPQRFNIKVDNDNKLIILHGTLMHSWYKLLPVFINKYLTYNQATIFPLSLAPIQLAIIHLDNNNLKVDKIYSNLKNNGVRVIIVERKEKNLSKILSLLKKDLIPYFIIIGKENDLDNDCVNHMFSDKKYSINSFINQFADCFMNAGILRIGRYDIDNIIY